MIRPNRRNPDSGVIMDDHAPDSWLRLELGDRVVKFVVHCEKPHRRPWRLTWTHAKKTRRGVTTHTEYKHFPDHDSARRYADTLWSRGFADTMTLTQTNPR